MALQTWGMLEAEVGNTEGARDLYSRSAKLNPKSVHALQAWATLEKKLGNYQDAEDLLYRVCY